MEAIVKALTDNLVAAIGLLLPALVGFALAWLKSKQAKLATEEAQKHAALAAVHEVEADAAHMRAVDQPLNSTKKKSMAMALVRDRLPKGIAPRRDESVGRLVENAVSELKEQQKARSSFPPGDDLEEPLDSSDAEPPAPPSRRVPRP